MPDLLHETSSSRNKTVLQCALLCAFFCRMFAKPIYVCALLAVVLATVEGFALAAGAPDSLIPFDKLDAAAKARVRRVVPGYTFYRHVPMPKPAIRARYDILHHLVSHLDQSSLVAQSLKIEDSRRERRPDGSYFGDNHKGTSGYLWQLRSAPGEQLYFGEGSAKEADSESGRAVLLFNYRELEPGLLQCHLHGFVQVDGAFRRFCAFLFQPFIMGMVDGHLREVVDTPMRIAEEATAHPDKVLKLIDSMPRQDAARVQEFRALLARPDTKS